jgi:hypothetical protein
MNDGTHITVAIGNEIIRAISVEMVTLGQAWTAIASEDSRYGKLGDEHINYVRGWLYPLWPPHRRQAEALIVAAALGPQPHFVQPPQSAVHMAKSLMDDVMKRVNQDIAKVMMDAEKMVEDAERLARDGRSVTITRRWP